jgi:hypothetical protein
MPKEQSPGKPTTRRYSPKEKAAAVRMVRTLRTELGTRARDGAAGDRLLVDLAERRGGRRRHRDQHAGAGVGGHSAPVKAGVQFRRVTGSPVKATAAQIFSPTQLSRSTTAGRKDRGMAQHLLSEVGCADEIGSPDHGVPKPRQVRICNANFKRFDSGSRRERQGRGQPRRPHACGSGEGGRAGRRLCDW